MLAPLFELHRAVTQDVPAHTRRYLFDKIAWDARAICITGARGVGKTTLLLQHYKEKYNDMEKCLYLPADNLHVISQKLLPIAEEYFHHGGEALIVDEVHKYPDWSREIKNIIDTYKNKRIMISGSSSLALGKGLSDLSRRVVYYDLPGLSFREYILFGLDIHLPPLTLNEILNNHTRRATSVCGKIPPLKHFRDYLRFGYYPYFREGVEVYPHKILNVIEKIISDDIPAIFGVRQSKVPTLKKILWLIATSQPFLPNVDRMSQTLGLSKEYVYHFLTYLQKSGLLLFVRGHGRGHKLTRKPAKILLENTNLMSAINSELKTEEMTGTLRETFFVNQLRGIDVRISEDADYCVEGRYHFEVGGKGKKGNKGHRKGSGYFIAADGIEIGANNKIPLYLFGFLY